MANPWPRKEGSKKFQKNEKLRYTWSMVGEVYPDRQDSRSPSPIQTGRAVLCLGLCTGLFYKVSVDTKVLNLKIIISDQHTEAQDTGTASKSPPTPHPSHCPT